MGIRDIIEALSDKEYNALLNHLKSEGAQINGFKTISKVRKSILCKAIREDGKKSNLEKLILKGLLEITPADNELDAKKNFILLKNEMTEENVIRVATLVIMHFPNKLSEIEEKFKMIAQERNQNNKEEPPKAASTINSNENDNMFDELNKKIEYTNIKLKESESKNKQLTEEIKKIKREIKTKINQDEKEIEKLKRINRDSEAMISSYETKIQTIVAKETNLKMLSSKSEELYIENKKLKEENWVYKSIHTQIAQAKTNTEIEAIIYTLLENQKHEEYNVCIKKTLECEKKNENITEKTSLSSPNKLLCNSSTVIIPKIDIIIPANYIGDCLQINESEFVNDVTVNSEKLEHIFIIESECTRNSMLRHIILNPAYKKIIKRFDSILELKQYLKG